MADDKDKKEKEKKEIITVKEKRVEVEHGQISLSVHPTIRALGKFCDLYIGIDENFQIMALNDCLADHQKKFVKLQEKIYMDVFQKPIPKIPEPEPDRSNMTQEEKQEAKQKDMEYGRRMGELSQKKIELVYPEITITKEALKDAMDREKKKDKGILITPNDIAQLRDFINFI